MMSAYPSFQELYARLQTLYQAEEYAAALNLTNQALEAFPENRTVLDYWRIALCAKTEDSSGALEAFRDALDHGSWFSELLLRRSPSLQVLQGNPAFEALIQRNQETAELEHARQYPLFLLRPQGKCQSGGPACPLLIGLHTNGGTVQSSIEFWKPAATLGWLVAAPQSSQALMKGAYVWDDRETAEREIRKDYNTLIENYSINPWQTVLAGHSLGGETAIWLTLKGALKNQYFLAVGPAGPWIDDLSSWQTLLKEDLPGGCRGYVLFGEEDDTISQENILEMIELFNRAGVNTAYESIPGAEHDYQPVYEAAILRALNYLIG